MSVKAPAVRMRGTVLNVWSGHAFLRHDRSGEQFFASGNDFVGHTLQAAVPGMLCEFELSNEASRGARRRASRVKLLS